MKIIKTVLFIIILVFLGTIIFQNQEYLFSKYAITIDLKFGSFQWVIPEFMNIGYFAVFFVFGFLVSGYIGVASKFKSRKQIRMLNFENGSYREQISSLKTELDKFKNDPYINTKSENDGEKSPETT